MACCGAGSGDFRPGWCRWKSDCGRMPLPDFGAFAGTSGIGNPRTETGPFRVVGLPPQVGPAIRCEDDSVAMSRQDPYPDPKRRFPLALPVSLAALFALLSAAVVGSGAVTIFDGAVNAFFEPWRTQPWLGIFIWLTTLGTGAALTAVMVTGSGLLWAHRRGGLIPPLWICFLGTEATTWTLKFAVGRSRPEFLTTARASSPSFPSAHSAGSLAVYAIVAWVIARDAPEPGTARWIRTAVGLLILVIGFSRIFLSVHYLTDVVGGFLVGLFWVVLAVALADRQAGR